LQNAPDTCSRAWFTSDDDGDDDGSPATLCACGCDREPPPPPPPVVAVACVSAESTALRLNDAGECGMSGSLAGRRCRNRPSVFRPFGSSSEKAWTLKYGVELKGVSWSWKASRAGIESEVWAERCAGKSS
jgi:hypothetical protein